MRNPYFLIRQASMVLTLSLPGIDNMFWFSRMSCFIIYLLSFLEFEKKNKSVTFFVNDFGYVLRRQFNVDLDTIEQRSKICTEKLLLQKLSKKTSFVPDTVTKHHFLIHNSSNYMTIFFYASYTSHKAFLLDVFNVHIMPSFSSN